MNTNNIIEGKGQSPRTQRVYYKWKEALFSYGADTT